jgi:hypothetical protein
MPEKVRVRTLLGFLGFVLRAPIDRVHLEKRGGEGKVSGGEG